MKLSLIIPLSVILLSGCSGAPTIQPINTDELKFAKLKKNVVFIDKALARGQTFELIELPNKQYATFVRDYTQTHLMSYMGPLAATRVHQGFILNEDLCTNGQYATYDGVGRPTNEVQIALHGEPFPDAHSLLVESGKFCLERI